MFHPRTLVALAVYTVAGAFGLILFVYATPRIEGALAPVLTNQRISFDKDDRTPGRMCWTWYWDKVRYAQPVTLAWSITVEGNAVEFPAVVEREQDSSIISHPTSKGIGPGVSNLCVDIPGSLDKTSGLLIKGQINYRMPHGLWTVWQDIPMVRVPPLS